MLFSWSVKVWEKGKRYLYILFVNRYDDYIILYFLRNCSNYIYSYV